MKARGRDLTEADAQSLLDDALTVLVNAFWQGRFQMAYLAAHEFFEVGRGNPLVEQAVDLSRVEEFTALERYGPLGYRSELIELLVAVESRSNTIINWDKVAPGESIALSQFEELAKRAFRDYPPEMRAILMHVAILPEDRRAWSSTQNRGEFYFAADTAPFETVDSLKSDAARSPGSVQTGKTATKMRSSAPEEEINGDENTEQAKIRQSHRDQDLRKRIVRVHKLACRNWPKRDSRPGYRTMATELIKRYGKAGKLEGWGESAIRSVLRGNYLNMREFGIGRIEVPDRDKSKNDPG